MASDYLTSDFRPAPFWWDDAPRPAEEPEALPGEVDVVVVGSGYTGLHAALKTARQGLGTLVLDADALGAGCSSRNGGQVSTSVKGTFPALKNRYGADRATSLLGEGIAALGYLDRFILEENLDCAWQRCGHFSGAHSKAAHTAAARALEALPPELGIEWHLIEKSEQRSEIGSDLYHGGVVFPNRYSLHPGQYHQELLDLVRAAGATAIGHCTVEQIERTGSGFTVQTSRGEVRAGKVAVATNGYSGQLNPWLQRRIIPIGSYIIATEPLDPQLAHELAPNNRTLTDSRKLVVYYRLSPDRRRLLFGGRVALSETDPRASAPALRAAMCRIFPQLAATRISHSWLGFVGYTFDTLPHVGVHEGVHYSMGYCGSGISLASYCGSIMGDRLCGLDHPRTVFEDLEFKTRPFYTGDPWFLKPAVAYHKLLDRL